MLGYLDALIAALSLRDASEAERLMTHPLARLLPTDVGEEARAFVAGEHDALAVPLRTMQLRRQTAELLQEAPALADAPEGMASEPPVRPTPPADALRDGPQSMAAAPRRRRTRPQQMELPLSA